MKGAGLEPLSIAILYSKVKSIGSGGGVLCRHVALKYYVGGGGRVDHLEGGGGGSPVHPPPSLDETLCSLLLHRSRDH